MKKIAAFLLILFICFSAFAEDSWRFNRRMAVNLDMFPVFFGIGYNGFGISAGSEYTFNPSISVKTNLYYLDINSSEHWHPVKKDYYFRSFRFQTEGRWYPMGRYLHGIFINGGLQYQGVYGSYIHYDSRDNRIIRQFDGFNSIGVYKGIGYKLIFGRSRSGVFVEPVVEYITTPRQGSLWQYRNIIEIANMGIYRGRFGFNIGAAF